MPAEPVRPVEPVERVGPAGPAVAFGPVPVLVALTVALQIGYALVDGQVRDAVTVLIVLSAAAAALTHAATTRGVRTGIALLLATSVTGFVVEVVGVHTGLPFGRYSYACSLGPRVAGVPVVIAFAWTMLAWPAALAARHLVSGTALRILLGGWALASWDLFLDPQMVAAGHWRWTVTGADTDARHLPGVPDVPLSNFAGWLVVSLAMSAVLQCWVLELAGSANPVNQSVPSNDEPVRSGRPASSDDRWPLGFYVWTWVSSVLALGIFQHLLAPALWGGLAMGTVALPLAVRSFGRPGRSVVDGARWMARSRTPTGLRPPGRLVRAGRAGRTGRAGRSPSAR